MHPVAAPSEKLLRIEDVMQKTGLSKTSIYDRAKAGTFPRQVRFSRRFAAWTESSVNAWIAEAIAKAQGGQ